MLIDIDDVLDLIFIAVNDPLTISCVCQQWRRVALNAPYLWSKFSITLRSIHHINLLDLYLHRSQQRPLSIVLHSKDHPEVTNLAFASLADVSHRIKHLVLRPAKRLNVSTRAGIPPSQPWALDTLTSLDLDYDSIISLPFCCAWSTPRLTSLSLTSHVNSFKGVNAPWKQITHLSLYSDGLPFNRDALIDIIHRVSQTLISLTILIRNTMNIYYAQQVHTILPSLTHLHTNKSFVLDLITAPSLSSLHTETWTNSNTRLGTSLKDFLTRAAESSSSPSAPLKTLYLAECGSVTPGLEFSLTLLPNLTELKLSPFLPDALSRTLSTSSPTGELTYLPHLQSLHVHVTEPYSTELATSIKRVLNARQGKLEALYIHLAKDIPARHYMRALTSLQRKRKQKWEKHAGKTKVEILYAI
ncbi:hypothetical protein AX17_007094 [Amanita inopinata Kibby_2008]|nr:hypothetical protein AX17_007094 [Amanita inopinata Kibby_2008]